MTERLYAYLWAALPLGLVVMPHLLRLPPWIALGWFGCLMVRLWQIRQHRKIFDAGRRSLLGLAAIAGTRLQFDTLWGPEAGVALLVLLSGLKLLEVRERRDHFFVAFMSYFVLMANFMASQELPLALYLFASSLALTAALMANQGDHRRPVRSLLRGAAVMTFQALPLTLLLFLIFPRLSGGLGGLLQSQSGTPGLTGHMEPGTISELILSEEIAFRVKFDDSNENGKALYWRGPVLWDFDGQRWRQANDLVRHPPRIDDLQGHLGYTLTLEPTGRSWLLTTGITLTPPIQHATLTADLLWLARDPIRARLGYRVSARRSYRLDPDLDPFLKERALALPTGMNPRSEAMIKEWTHMNRDPGAIVSRALNYFRSEPFHYTLYPPRLQGEHRMDQFLFDTRRGFCEHFASAFVVLMRMAGIPARIVTGYQGGEQNPLGNYWIVRQRDAHAWTEVWLSDQGWVRVDPTAAVAPNRIELGVNAALPAGELPRSLTDSAWLIPLRQAWDLVNSRWHGWVLGYDHERQQALLEWINPALTSLRGMLWGLTLGGTLLLAMLGAILFMPRRLTPGDPAVRLYERYCKRLERSGVTRQPYEGPGDFLERAIRAHPHAAFEMRKVTDLYVRLRYGQPSISDWQTLRRAVNQFCRIKLAENRQPSHD